MKHAPIFVKGYDLFVWLNERLQGPEAKGLVAEKVLQQAACFLESVTLALKGFQQELNLEEADRALVLLRLYLRLAGEGGHLSDRQQAYAFGQVEELGRQLGGWLKSIHHL